MRVLARSARAGSSLLARAALAACPQLGWRPDRRHGLRRLRPCSPGVRPSVRRSISCSRKRTRGRAPTSVLRGEAGIGKSALLEYAAERADGCRVLHAVGAEWEMELPFAGLHQLCAGLLDHRERLPAPQREALATAFGLSSGAQPDRFLVGLAVLSLLSEAAEERPLVCLVDDVQWLDRSSAQVLAFVARRLAAESVVLLFAERDPGGVEELAGLPELRLGGLPDADRRGNCSRRSSARPWTSACGTRILAETRGNPLALLELPRESRAGRTCRWFRAAGRRIAARSESKRASGGACSSCRQRRSGCCSWPRPTRRVSPRCSSAPRSRSASRSHELSPAEADGLLELGPQVTFRHPLLRSAIYRAASSDERRAAHRALAAATDPRVRPRSARLASRARDRGARRGRRPRAGAVGRARPRARWARSRRRVPRAIGGAHARPGPPGSPRAGGRRQQAPGRRVPGSAEAARERRRRAAGPVGSRQAEAPARRDRGSEAHPRRAAAAPRRGQAARTA